MVANEDYLPGKVNFSCRVARCAKSRDPPVDIIQSLRAYASMSSEHDQIDGSPSDDKVDLPLLERLGDNFARGHVQASGGIVEVTEFEELLQLMQVGVKAEKKEGAGTSPKKGSKKVIDSNQKNTLMNYFGKG